MWTTDYRSQLGAGFKLGLLVTATSVAPVLAVASAAPDAGVPALQSDFGGVGLLQTPTARMADTGELSINYHKVDPYALTSLSLQPFDWLEFGFRYTSISNRDWSVSSQDRDYLDKGVNVKLRLIEEGRYMPAVALGLRDLGGTGLFSGEYLVASKRWHNFDFSLGLGWGYLAAGGSISNPLGVFSNHFKHRQQHAGGRHGGKFSTNQMFTGDVGFFGGIAYQTPWEPLVLQVEYDGNDYEHEPLNNNQEQDSRFNFGAKLKLSDNFTLAAGWERGNTAMLGLTFHANLAHLTQSKADPAPVPAKQAPNTTTDDWNTVARQLEANAGIHATRIVQQDDTLVVEGQATTYRSLPTSELRGNRILHNATGKDIKQFKYRWENAGLYLREDTLPRDPLPKEVFIAQHNNHFTAQDYRNDIFAQGFSAARADAGGGISLYENRRPAYDFSISPGLQINYGGPDGFLYQTLINANARVWTDPNGFFSGTLGYVLFGNFDKYEYLAPSGLPRVRSHIGEYLDQTDLGVFNFQYTRTARLGENWYGMGYIGYLEMMYGGAGGEVLYRPFNSPLAIGADVNWVKQRDFDGGFGFRDYDTVTGHLTTYWDTGFKNVLAKVSVGRYLAGDWGTTIDLSREFESGVRVGAYATFTNASSDAYGEGSFDKVLYIEIPWDAIFTRSSRNTLSLTWDPLTRDGGARLHRRYQLYDMTQDRALGHYWGNFQQRR